MEKKELCVICGKEIEGFGNNPEPVKSSEEGQCCNECNEVYVIPQRIKDLMK